MTDFEKRLAALERSANEQTAKLDSFERDRERLNRENADLSAQIKNLRESNASLSRDIDRFSAENAQLVSENARLVKDLARERAKIAKWQHAALTHGHTSVHEALGGSIYDALEELSADGSSPFVVPPAPVDPDWRGKANRDPNNRGSGGGRE